jgi:ATP-dependent protease ClpP protease subunit
MEAAVDGGRFVMKRLPMDQLERIRSHPACLDAPQISLLGEVNEDMLRDFFAALANAEKSGGDIAIELTTPGGDAEFARRLVLEIQIAQGRLKDRRILFLGKTQVYSAGTTIMSAFPKEDRFLTRDAVVMVHCRQLDKTIEIAGPIRASLPQIDALKQQIETGLRLEEDNFRRLIKGSGIDLEELFEKALHNWYLTAEEALKRGLVAAII